MSRKSRKTRRNNPTIHISTSNSSSEETDNSWWTRSSLLYLLLGIFIQGLIVLSLNPDINDTLSIETDHSNQLKVEEEPYTKVSEIVAAVSRETITIDTMPRRGLLNARNDSDTKNKGRNDDGEVVDTE